MHGRYRDLMIRVGYCLNLNDSDSDSLFRFRLLTVLDSDSFKRQGQKSLGYFK